MGFFSVPKVAAAVTTDVHVAGAFANQAGFRHALKGVKAIEGRRDADIEVLLRAQPRNKHDPRAIQVTSRGFALGHIPADRVEEFHPQLLAAKPALLVAVARVWRLGEEWHATLPAQSPDHDALR